MNGKSQTTSGRVHSLLVQRAAPPQRARVRRTEGPVVFTLDSQPWLRLSLVSGHAGDAEWIDAFRQLREAVSTRSLVEVRFYRVAASDLAIVSCLRLATPPTQTVREVPAAPRPAEDPVVVGERPEAMPQLPSVYPGVPDEEDVPAGMDTWRWTDTAVSLEPGEVKVLSLGHLERSAIRARVTWNGDIGVALVRLRVNGSNRGYAVPMQADAPVARLHLTVDMSEPGNVELVCSNDGGMTVNMKLTVGTFALDTEGGVKGDHH